MARPPERTPPALDLTVSIGDQTYAVDLRAAIDASIRLIYDGPQPNLYGVPQARASAFEDGSFVGDTRRGGSCNFEQVSLIPHCHGTHTECVGHISLDRLHVNDLLTQPWHVAQLVSVNPVAASSTSDTYQPKLEPEDHVITRAMLKDAWSHTDMPGLSALIIRTHPNPPSKRHRAYLGEPAAFFSKEAMTWIAGLPIEHLLVDLPSVDRAFDDGVMCNHHTFWGLTPGPRREIGDSASPRTITELVYLPDTVPDGVYLLQLQLMHSSGDAVPSRPHLYPLHPC